MSISALSDAPGAELDACASAGGVPAEGQLVTVRNRQWVASSVERSTIVADEPGSPLIAVAQHLVALVSIEDDARDEELRVVWELEPGAVIHDHQTLPSAQSGFDEPGTLDAFLDAVRWGAIASADKTVLQAPFRSGIQIQDYQLDPVVRALRMPRTNLLIADDVGLGKTVEAGLVMQELMLRHRARTALIVCPASLTRQWREEMRDKFGIDFRIVDTELLRDLRRQRGVYANPWTHYPRLIVSIDWLKRDRPLALLRSILPAVPEYPRAFDLLIVDEVHTCAPSGVGKYAVDSQRTIAVKTLAKHCEHRLFLSATPHNGYLESFTALLELLDDQRFARGVKPSEQAKARAMVRRLKRDLPPKWDGTPLFPRRELEALEVAYSAEARAAYAKLDQYARLRSQGAASKAQRSASEFVVKLLKRRFLSCPKAFAETIDAHVKTMTARDAAADDRGFATGVRSVGESVLRNLMDRLDETAERDDEYAETETAALETTRRIAAPLTPAERTLLEELRTWARGEQDRADGKFTSFLDWLRPLVRPGGAGSHWDGERVIVFSEYRDTQRWLKERLIGAGIPPTVLAELYGGQDEQERERVKEQFQEDPQLSPIRILLATDAASEGINLQNHCHRVVHWEIPWNPNRLEQRNGRVDRHGQHAARVDIAHFVPVGWQGSTGAADSDDTGFADGTLEDAMAFLGVAVRKVDRIREDLGSAGEVIAAQVEQKMLGRRSDWQTTEREIAGRAGRAELKVNLNLAQDLENAARQLRESRSELNLGPETVERVVRTALRLAHRLDLVDAAAPEGFAGRCFTVPPLPGAWGQARNAGLLRPLTGQERPVTFDQDAAADRKDVVLMHLGHPLVDMCLRLLRAELWAASTRNRGYLSRVTAKVVPGDLLRSPVAIAHGRVVVTGTRGIRLHEQIVLAGGPIEQGKLKVLRGRDAEHLEQLLAAASDELPPDEVTDRLVELWPALERDLARALRTASNAVARRQNDLLARRCEEDVAAMTQVLAELERSIRAALDDTAHWQQGSLLEVDQEREQLTRDHEALRGRLQGIPAQLEAETAQLRLRYADPVPRAFPVAVTFLVPAALAHASARQGRG